MLRVHASARGVSARTINAAVRGFLGLVALHASCVAAQTKGEPGAKSDDIVVTGRSVGDADKQIRDFVHAMTPTPGNDPLARFDVEQLCPQALGLAPTYNEAITDRMRRVATAANIDIARQGCGHVNALVIFADDKAATIAFLKKRYPELLEDAYGDLMKVGKNDGPASAWHLKRLATQDGQLLIQDGSGLLSSRTATQPSRLQSSVRPTFLMAVVVIERRGIQGLTVTQIADYAAMRAFTDASPSRAAETGAPTILTVLETPMGSETPPSLTAWDLGFLRGLYASPPSSFANFQRGAIGTSMKRELGSSGSGKR